MTTPHAHTIFLADLTHVTPLGYGAEMTPYAVGCIKAWFHEYSRHGAECEVRLFKHPQRFIDQYLSSRPTIVGFSNYMWNLDLSYALAEEVKRHHRETLVVFGGPNYPMEDSERQRWLATHPAVDVYVIGDGEEPFTRLVDLWIETGSIDLVKRSGIDGAHALVDGALVMANHVSPRVTDLDRIPSPYVHGYLDEFLDEVALTPLLESNRGCPFSCTFCVDGIGARTKVYWKSAHRFEEELVYIASRYKGQVLDLADVNFGMYKQDLEISRIIARVRRQHRYPAYLHTATGKNQKTRVIDCADILDGALRLSASVQSLDAGVLLNIKRQNISGTDLVTVAQMANETNANTYSELILGLPGDTKEKHIESAYQLADADMKLISLYTLMMLDGTELTSTASRQHWQFETRFRVVPRCFGVYQFGERRILSAEPEEVAVASRTMTFDDYLECREFALTMGLFYQDRILFELYRFLSNFSIRTSDLLRLLHARRRILSSRITELYESFVTETRAELWDSCEALVSFVRSGEEVIDKYISGELGNNILFRYRARALLELLDDIHHAAFVVAAEVLAAHDPATAEAYLEFLDELKRYSLLRKRGLFEIDGARRAYFDYDFRSLVEHDFREIPTRLPRPQEVRFDRTAAQRELLAAQFAQYGHELNAIGRIVSRVAMSNLQRAVTFDGVPLDGRIPRHATGQKLSPGEFA